MKGRRRRNLVLLCSLLPILFLGMASPVTAGQQGQRLLAEEKVRNKVLAIPGANKVSSTLRKVIAEMQARGITSQNARELGAKAFSNQLVRVDEEGRIQTYVHFYSLSDDNRVVLERDEVAIETVNQPLGIVQAWIPFSRVYEVAQLAFVRRITPPSYAIHNAGSVTTEGDTIIGTDQMRGAGCKGKGVNVGVISDGVDNRAAAQATGDLPADVTVVTYAGSGDEGTAMLEIVHDLAPEARLGFCGPQTSVEMVQCVTDLAGVFGARIIVDDLAFLGEPYFEDGSIAQAVSNVLPNVVYASSAGNFAQEHYEGNYQTVSYQGEDCHDFGRAAGKSSDATMNVLVASGGYLLVVLQWNDPFGGSGNDYDLYIFNDAEDEIVAGSNNYQEGSDDPVEAALFQNTSGSTVRVKVVVNKFTGANRFMEMILHGNSQVEQYNVPEGSINGHAAVPGVLATAAIAANDPGHDTVEPFSSRGPSRIFFPAAETRPKPDITAIDGVSVTGAGGFPSPFYGTSASAPHVAGLAALLRPLFPTAAATVAAIKNGSVDLGSSGFDYTFGAGLISAQDYLEMKCTQPAAPWIPLLLLDE